MHIERDGDALRFVCKQVHHDVRPYVTSYKNLTCDSSLYGFTCADVWTDQDCCSVEYVEITGKVPMILVTSLMEKIHTKFPNLWAWSVQIESLD